MDVFEFDDGKVSQVEDIPQCASLSAHRKLPDGTDQRLRAQNTQTNRSQGVCSERL